MILLSKQCITAVMLTALLTACGRQDALSVSDAPNIVLVTLDCLRADRLAAYGGDPDWTPNLNDLASKGTVFINAHSVNGVTFPSHATMLTGLYPRYHGVRSNFHTLPKKFKTLAEYLSEAGYATGSFVSFRQMHLTGNLDQGFDALSDAQRTEKEPRNGARTIAMTTNWLESIESDDERPFFLWVHLFDAHGPHLPTDWSKQQLQDYSGMLKEGVFTEHMHKYKRDILASPNDIRALATLYTGEVRKLDSQVGTLLDSLRALGELAHSVVIAVGDHGQGIGISGHMGHGPVLTEEILRVPFVVTDFRQPHSNRISDMASTVDITPTVLDIIGIKRGNVFQGRSLKPVLSGGPLQPFTYFADVARKPDFDDYGKWYTPDRVAVYDSGFKLEHDPAEESILFDLTDDPLANRPLDASEHKIRMDFMLGLAKDYLSSGLDSQRAKLSESDLETLKSLGYIQ